MSHPPTRLCVMNHGARCDDSCSQAVEFAAEKGERKILKKIILIESRKKVNLCRNLNIYEAMTVVSSKEFATNQRKFYNLALNERVVIKRGKNTFYLASFNGINDDESADLAEAMERADDENTSADDFIRFLRGKGR
jgi:predicted transcriptional regulator